MTQTTPTRLWNDSATLSELTYSIEHGAVAATCNPVIVLEALKQETKQWNARIQQLAGEMPTAHAGPAVEEFDSYGPTARTLRQFLEATHELASRVRDVVLPNPDVLLLCAEANRI